MTSFRELIVKIGADAQAFSGVLDGAIGKLGALGPIAVAGSAAAVTAIAAVGAAAFKVGVDFDGANKVIRAGTGATGEAFEGLKASAKTVFQDVDESIGEVSKTLADLNTATGATGPSLETLTRQMLDLSDLGVGFSGDVQNLTRVYGDWGIAIDDAAASNDYLFKVAQTTGAGVDDLAGKVVQFGAPLRQMGFDFESSAALMGKWQQEGVNTETVMAGMRVGLANLSEAGGDVPANFKAAMESIKSAGSVAEANTIAFEVFGKRAGPDMAAAILEGRFEVDELMSTLEASSETISGVADESATLGEKVGEMTNKVMAGLEPLGSFMVDVLGTGISFVGDIWDALAIQFGAFFDLIGVTGLPSLTDFSGGIQVVADTVRDYFVKWLAMGMQSTISFLEVMSKLPVVGDKFASKLEGQRAALAKLTGELDKAAPAVSKLADKVGPETKPGSFSAAAKKGKDTTFDLEKALKAAADEAAQFEKDLESARRKGAEEFTKAIESGAIPALKDLDTVSGTTANAMLSDVLAMTGGVGPLITELEDIPRRTKDVEAAFATLESKSVADLQKLYDGAKGNFDLIQESGEATPRQITEAWRNELEAQKALLNAQGKDLSAEEAAILADLNAKLEAGTDQMESTWSQFATNVGGIVSDLGGKLFSDLLEGKFSLSNVTSALGSIKDAFASALFDPVSERINTFITESIDKLIGKLTGSGGLTGALDKVFGGGSLGGSVGGSVGGALGGGSGPGGSSAGGAAGGFGGLVNPIGMIAGVGSLFSGILGNFQTAKTNDRLWDVREYTQDSSIHLEHLLNAMHVYNGANQWERHEGLLNTINALSDRRTSDSWQQNGLLIQALGQVPTMAADTVAAVEKQEQAVSDSLENVAESVENQTTEYNKRTETLRTGLSQSYQRGQEQLGRDIDDDVERLSRDIDSDLRTTRDDLGRDIEAVERTVDDRIPAQTRDLEGALGLELGRLGGTVGEDLAALGDQLVVALGEVRDSSRAAPVVIMPNGGPVSGGVRQPTTPRDAEAVSAPVMTPAEEAGERTRQGLLEIMRATDERLVSVASAPSEVVQEIQNLSAAVRRMAERPVEVMLDGEKVSASVQRYQRRNLYY